MRISRFAGYFLLELCGIVGEGFLYLSTEPVEMRWAKVTIGCLHFVQEPSILVVCWSLFNRHRTQPFWEISPRTWGGGSLLWVSDLFNRNGVSHRCCWPKYVIVGICFSSGSRGGGGRDATAWEKWPAGSIVVCNGHVAQRKGTENVGVGYSW